MRQMMQNGLLPFLVRFYDRDEARHLIRQDKAPGNVMLLGFEGIKSIAEAEYKAGMAICQAEGGHSLGPEIALSWMERRFDFSTIENLLNQEGGFAETIEVAHFWGNRAETYYALKKALLPLAAEVLGHFSHVYSQGSSLYIILLGKVENDVAAEERLMQIWETAMNICLEQKAVISHHHGIGLARLPYVQQDLSSSFTVFEKVKQALDPRNILNPGKFGLGKTE